MSLFVEKLTTAAQRNRSLLCVGLDVDPRLAPPSLVGRDGWIERFTLGIVEATADLVCAYKPNLAFFEALGIDGYQGLRRTLDGLPKDVVSIGDAKRGDVGNTAAAYARALFDVWGFDAATVNPYLGHDALQPFLDYRDRGVFVVCKTSNPGSGDFQDLATSQAAETISLYERVARYVVEWNEAGNCGLVVGATYPRQLRHVRSLAPDLPILVPGIGAQQGDLEGSVLAGLDSRGGGIILNAARQVLYASAGPDWQTAAHSVAQELRSRLEAARQERLDAGLRAAAR
ncbi:MAG TPA: orotidine-5'-phosphate decarboxylase [Chloroflexota bacterium]|nr:orotidine-5'-phosphate decarboxylase [Chloroflexota bacterium]